MTEEVKETKAVAKENKFKKLLDLDPIFTAKFGPKLKPYAKYVYYILSGILAIALLGAFVHLFVGGLTAFIIDVLLIAVDFIVVRMFAEYLANN